MIDSEERLRMSNDILALKTKALSWDEFIAKYDASDFFSYDSQKDRALIDIYSVVFEVFDPEYPQNLKGSEKAIEQILLFLNSTAPYKPPNKAGILAAFKRMINPQIFPEFWPFSSPEELHYWKKHCVEKEILSQNGQESENGRDN